MKKRIVLALGSNVGNRRIYLQKAIKLLTDHLQLTTLKQSQILENKALLLPGSPPEWNRDFYNMALSADIDFTKFQPLKILKIIKRIESDLGRVDRGRWSPREIDIDILAIDNLSIDLKEKLKIPHQELLNRDFFIEPFRQIEPELLQLIQSLKIKN